MAEQEAQEPVLPEQAPRRAVRHRANEGTTPAKAARRTAASKIVPLPAKKLRAAPVPVPEHVPTITELALHYPSIIAFPGLARSTAASSLPTHASPQHPHGRLSVRQCLSELRGALAEGWEIVQPIFARPLWSVTDDSTTAFNFVLHRELATRLIVVPEGRTVERFIRDRHLTVDYRR
jgi:hypothetical protein